MKTILIFRHAEKPDDPKDHHLSVAGRERADRLVDYIHRIYGKPHYIFAAKNSHESHRPVETATPLAKAFGLDIITTYEDKAYRVLAGRLDHWSHEEKLNVIFWHHGSILQLIERLGAPYMGEWPDDVFDQYIELKIGVHSSIIKEPF